MRHCKSNELRGASDHLNVDNDRRARDLFCPYMVSENRRGLMYRFLMKACISKSHSAQWQD